MTHSTARDRSQLELLWRKSADVRTAPTSLQPSLTLSELMRQLGHSLVAFLTGTQQLRIWTKSTKQGVMWFAYDPITDRRIGHCSEAELRTWLESRHHH